VNIDAGRVSIMEREILTLRKYKHTAAATRLSLSYLESRSPLYNSLFHAVILQGGSRIQQIASRLARPFLKRSKPGHRSAMMMLKSPMTPVPSDNLHQYLPDCREDQAVLIEPPKDSGQVVFYFPGCGSERLFSDIAMASVYLLLKAGCRVIVPPPAICCGFPAKANAKSINHNRIFLRNSIILTQIRKMFGYLDFDACLVSCGTCMEGLLELGADRIFGASIEDVSGFSLRNGLTVTESETCLYHMPCHDTFSGTATEVLKKHAPYTLHSVPHCCSEAGTMAMSRPDIANALRERKADAISNTWEQAPDARKILTNCPSCIQGLGRNRSNLMQPWHIAVDLAEKTGGKKWPWELKGLLQNSESVTF
jgi:Fe-S oxidoreductase